MYTCAILFLVTLFLRVAFAVTANPITISIVGSATGTFTTKDLPKGVATIESYSWGVVSPRDASSGLATGKRQYDYVTITRTPSLMSAQIMSSISRNEILKSVVIITPLNGMFKQMILTNANFVSYQENTGVNGSLEQFSIAFQKIEVDIGTAFFVDSVPSGTVLSTSPITFPSPIVMPSAIVLPSPTLSSL